MTGRPGSNNRFNAFAATTAMAHLAARLSALVKDGVFAQKTGPICARTLGTFLMREDCHTREALATAARMTFLAYQVIGEVDRIAPVRGKPRSIRIDNIPCRENLVA